MNEISISLPEALNEFVRGEVASGRYESPSQFLEDLVRQAQKQRARQSVDRLLVEGLESGEPGVMTCEEWQAIRREVGKRAARRNGQ